MPWYSYSFTDSIKNKACKHLLQHYLGSFLHKLNVEQLSIDIYNGTGQIQDVQLDVQGINQTLETAGMPFKLVDGFIHDIAIAIPWSALLTDDVCVEIQGLEVTLQPSNHSNYDMDVSLLSGSMTSSRSLAEECLKDDNAAKTLPEGLEAFANTIESVLSRIKITLLDTVVRLEHCPSDSSNGIALELRIKRLEYFDEASRDLGTSVDGPSEQPEPKVFMIKNIHIKGEVSLHTDIFSPCHRSTMTQSHDSISSTSPDFFSQLSSPDVFASAVSHPDLVMRQPSYVGVRGQDTLPQEHDNLNSDPIKFLVITGEQRVKVKIKKDSKVPGPKSNVDIHLSTIGMMVIPKQVHLITELVTAYSESMSGSSSPTNDDKTVDSMDDYVEQMLHNHLLEHQMLSAPGQTMTSAQHFMLDPDEVGSVCSGISTESHMFQSVGRHNSGLSDMETSICSDYSASTTSRPSTSLPTHLFEGPKHNYTSAYRQPSWRRNKDATAIEELSAQVTVMKLNVAFAICILLNENPQTTPSDALDPGESDIEKLKIKSHRFFDGFKSQRTRGVLHLENIREEILAYVKDSHLKLIAKKVDIEAKHKSQQLTRRQKGESSLELSIGHCDVTEWLAPPQNTRSYPHINLQPINEVLTFHHDDAMPSSHPCVKVTVNSSSSQHKGVSSADKSSSRINVDVRFCRPLSSEVDISITDRLYDLLKFTPICVSSSKCSFSPSNTYMSYSNSSSPTSSAPSSSSQEIVLNIRSESEATVFLRFPIADLRKDTSQRLPWWRRNLRQEMLEFQLFKPSFSTVINSQSDGSRCFELTCRSILGYFHMGANEPRIAFANIGQDLGDKEELEWPRLVVKTQPSRLSSLLEEEEEESSLDSLSDACQVATSNTSSPFSNKKVMYNNEELIMSGDREEMGNFQHITKSNTQLFLQLDLPAVNIVIPSKHVFEVLYNRFCNDLLMWESVAPTSRETLMNRFTPADQGLNNLGAWGASRYALCRSTLHQSSEVDESDDDTLGYDEMLYSIHNSSKDKRRLQTKFSGQSKACVQITIKKGRLTMAHTKQQDTSEQVDMEVHGQSALDVEDTVIYINSETMGDPTLRYISVQCSQATLYHTGLLRCKYHQPEHIERLQAKPPDLFNTLELSLPDVPSKLNYTVGTKGSQDMLNVAIKITADPDPKKNIKNVVVAVGLRGATLHHQMVPGAEMWITQLIELLALDDYEVLGYPFPRVVTELHVHMMGCAVDYRPKFLALRGLLTLGKCSISSNVVINSPVSLLRFLVEDAAFWLTDQCKVETRNVIQDYICLMEMSHFVLDLRTTDGTNLKYPKTDLKAACTALHVKTCSDTCRALQNFITYLADNVDVQDTESSATTTTLSEGSTVTSNTDVDCTMDSSISTEDSEAPALPGLMEDAMHDSLSRRAVDPMTMSIMEGDLIARSIQRSDPMTSSILIESQHEKAAFAPMTFIFPDERPGETVTVAGSDDEDSNSSVDFCFVDIPDISPEKPVIEKLDRDPLVVREDYLQQPKSRVDLLSPPQNFPNPVSKYCLSDLTVVWDLYGGHDFGGSIKHPSSYSTDRFVGGSGRDLDTLIELQLSKIRLQYEIYPDNTPQASRQVLLIQDVEIRDRLAKSEVNKMLYQYTSEKLPKQQHTSMISIKALTLKPNLIHSPSVNECSVRVSIQPLRLNLDQDALFFLYKFANGVATVEKSANAGDTSSHSPLADRKHPHSSPTAAGMPVMSFGDDDEAVLEGQNVLFDEIDGDTSAADDSDREGLPLVFIKNFVFTPDVSIRLDYVGKGVEMERRLEGLLIGLAHLNRAEITLKSLHFKQGILGVERLLSLCLNEWKRDITRCQLPAIIGGVGPLNSFVQFFHGVQDLVWLPIEQYRKDGRIVRGLQKGANAFSTSTTVAFIELTNRAVQALQGAAEITFDLVSTGSTSKRQHRRRSQPRDVREGVSNAMRVVREGVNDTASTVYKTAMRESETKGLAGAVGGVVRQIPSTVVSPIILAADATSNMLSGLRNQLHPDAHREDQEKWKTHDKK